MSLNNVYIRRGLTIVTKSAIVENPVVYSAAVTNRSQKPHGD